MTTVQRALELMQGRRVLLVGDLMLDVYLYGETQRVSREAPVLVVRKERQEYRLGGAANVAANFAALGVETELIGVLAEDDAGLRLRQMLADTGADISWLRRGGWTTPSKTRVLAGAFGTARQQVLRVDEQEAGRLPEDLAEDLAKDLRVQATDADLVVISDYGIGVVNDRVAAAAREVATNGTPVFVDSRHRLAAFAGVTVVKPNAPEAAELVGFALADDDAVRRAGSEVLERLGCEACLLTLGRGGMTLFERDGEPCSVDIVGDEEVTDVTGAGDTVTATFCAALAAGLGRANAMRLANCAAGVVVMKTGTGVASPDEIIELAGRGDVELEPWGG